MNKNETFMEKVINSPLYTAVGICFFSVIFLFLVMVFNSTVALMYFKGAKVVMEIITAVLFGLMYGLYNKRMPDFKFLSHMFSYFASFGIVILLLLILKSLFKPFDIEPGAMDGFAGVLGVKFLFIFPFLYTLFFYISCLIFNFKSGNSLALKPQEINNESAKFLNKDAKLIDHSPLTAAFEVTLIGTLSLLIIIFLPPFAAGVVPLIISMALDYISITNYKNIYGLKLIKPLGVGYMTGMGFALFLFLIIRIVFYFFMFFPADALDLFSFYDSMGGGGMDGLGLMVFFFMLILFLYSIIASFALPAAFEEANYYPDEDEF